jgi:hypothetical protein
MKSVADSIDFSKLLGAFSINLIEFSMTADAALTAVEKFGKDSLHTYALELAQAIVISSLLGNKRCS